MAQGSAFHDGTTIGDAGPAAAIFNAPYGSDEFSYFFSLLLGSHAARGFVISAYGNNLRVLASAPVDLNVVVDTGSVYIRGRLHENNATEILTIATAHATNPRLDRVVVTYTAADNDIRLEILTGTAAATPSLPALTQTAAVYQISLAYVWVAATAANIDNADIHDERVFAPNFEERLTGVDSSQLLKNTEFLASITARTYPPANWSLVSTPSAIATTTRPTQMSRGNAIQITADAASEGISQAVSVRGTTTYAIRVLFNVTAGDGGSIVVTDNGATPSTITRTLRRTGGWLEELIYYITPSDATTLTIQLLANSATDIVKYGQALLLEGYSPGSFRPSGYTEAMTLLDEIELTATASSITFNIPSGYKHLRIVATLRGNQAVVNQELRMQLNGDTGGNYDGGYFYFNAGSSNTDAYGATSITIGQCPGASAPANTVAAYTMDIPDYLEATLLHAVKTHFHFINATSNPGFSTGIGGGRWRTAAALTSVTLLLTASTFAIGSRVSVYGIN